MHEAGCCVNSPGKSLQPPNNTLILFGGHAVLSAISHRNHVLLLLLLLPLNRLTALLAPTHLVLQAAQAMKSSLQSMFAQLMWGRVASAPHS